MPLDQIDNLCDEFESSRKRGEFVTIEDFLNRIGETDRDKLLRELLEIEVELAASPISDDATVPVIELKNLHASLLSRFPQNGKQIDSMIRRSMKLRQMGDYEIIGELGHGGMGVVYQARQKLLNQDVAIKVLANSLLDDAQAVGRFRREMQLIGSLNHVNIVRALNAGEVDGSHFLVMEYVDGITLQRLVNHRQGKKSIDLADSLQNLPIEILTPTGIPFGAACEIIRQSALGLQHAFEYGLVHRDIKPGNIMIDRIGTVKILDLGLGKFLEEASPHNDGTSLTMAGTTIGTVDYISPEQCENAGDVTIGSDLYSLGCTFYFALIGEPPYFGPRYDTTRKKLMAHIVGDVPNARKINSKIPVSVQKILDKLLAKSPKDRFQTPIELAEALEPISSFSELEKLLETAISSEGKQRTPSSTNQISRSKQVSRSHSLFPFSHDFWNRVALSAFVLLVIVALIASFCILRNTAIHSESQVAGQNKTEQNIDGQNRTEQNVDGQKTKTMSADGQNSDAINTDGRSSDNPNPYNPTPDSQNAGKQNINGQNIFVPTVSGQNAQRQQNEVAISKRDILLEDLALLPGLNGSWWFDEMPWFLPGVRFQLLQQVLAEENPESFLGNDSEKYFDPNPANVELWLWNLVQKSYKENGEKTSNMNSTETLSRQLKSFFDSDAANSSDDETATSLKKLLDEFCRPVSSVSADATISTDAQLLTKPQNAPQNAVLDQTTAQKNRSAVVSDSNELQKATNPDPIEFHTQAILEHRLAILQNDQQLAIKAAEHYRLAIQNYRQKIVETKNQEKESPQTKSNTETIWNRLMLLCRSDAARLEYLATGSYTKGLEAFENIFNEIQSGNLSVERVSPLFFAEFCAEYGAFCSASGQYQDSIFLQGQRVLESSKAGERSHPLAAHLAERNAWSQLDQWKIKEAQTQFNNALLIRSTNWKESKNPFAIIFVLHNLHGRAMTLRYLGQIENSVEEYRNTLAKIDQERTRIHDLSGPLDTSNNRRYSTILQERAGNTRERLADCVLYGGAASGLYGTSRLKEAVKLYDEAAELYEAEGISRVMKCKQAILLLLLGNFEEADRILCDLDEQTKKLIGNQMRTDQVRQVADALRVYFNQTELAKKRILLHQFMEQFLIPSNPVSREASRRETLELRIFCGEFLLHECLKAGEKPPTENDILFLTQPLGFFGNRLELRPFLRRICDLLVECSVQMAMYSTDDIAKQSQLRNIVRILGGMRWTEEMPDNGQSLPTLLFFFLSDKSESGFVLFYPQDGRDGTLFPLPLTRQQVKHDTKGSTMELPLQLIEMVKKELKDGREVKKSWTDAPVWNRSEDAFSESDWPFGKVLE
ncbi:MAG: serine/threonine protein kinase [Thermoguttaceae bacterium]